MHVKKKDLEVEKKSFILFLMKSILSEEKLIVELIWKIVNIIITKYIIRLIVYTHCIA